MTLAKAIERVETFVADWFGGYIGRTHTGQELRPEHLKALVAAAKRGQELERRDRKPRPENSDYPTYPNPHPHGVTVEWVFGRGWVRVSPRPKRGGRGK